MGRITDTVNKILDLDVPATEDTHLPGPAHLATAERLLRSADKARKPEEAQALADRAQAHLHACSIIFHIQRCAQPNVVRPEWTSVLNRHA